MLKERLTLLIHSCNKFSDLWDAHVKLLNQNWADRGIRTIILTDTPRPDLNYHGVEIIGAGAGKEITERIRYILPIIDTEYVLVTLDDYFLTTPISTKSIERLVDIAESENLDYIRLFKDPKCPEIATKHKGVATFNLDGEYRVNLYSGIWRTDFIEKTLGNEVMNAWNFEVVLTDRARSVNGHCAVSHGNEFPILDVVRKGHILPKAWKYLHKNHLYNGDRPMMPISAFYQLEIKTKCRNLLMHLPTPLYEKIRVVCVAFGIHSFAAQKKS